MRKSWSMFVVSALGLGIWASGGGHPVAAAPVAQTDSMSQLSKLSGADFEKQFLSMMIEHHQGALDMAALVPARANHAEVKTLAGNILSSQSKEIADMTGWLQSWYSMAPQKGMMSMSDMGMDMGKLESLQGDSFDQEFLKQMRMHHASAVEMANLVPSRAVHQELKDLAQNIIKSQTQEMDEMAAWLKAWYGVDVSTSMGGPTGDMGNMGNMGGSTSGSSGGMGMPATGGAPAVPWWGLVALLGLGVLVGGVILRRHPAA